MTHLSVAPGPYRRAENQPSSVEIRLAPGLFVKSMSCAEVGMLIPQHAHSFDHLSMLAVGRVLVWADGECLGPFEAPAGILIKANVRHLFKTLTPNVLIYCIHRVGEDGEPAIEAEHHLPMED
jgi:quercetin dioxygenase-like cupin family protein